VDCVKQHTKALYQAIRDRFVSAPAVTESMEATLVYLCPNSLDYAMSILAATEVAAYNTKRRCWPALLNTRWSISEMRAALQPASYIMLIYDSAKISQDMIMRLNNALQEERHPNQVALMPLPTFGSDAVNVPMITSDTSRHPPQEGLGNTNHTMNPQELASISASTDALIVFTSGTTSTPKGVRLSHRALLVQAAAKGQKPCGYTFETRLLADALPLFHVGGLSSWLAVWMAGGALVTTLSTSISYQHSQQSFSPVRVCTSLQHDTEPVNTLVVVPAMVHTLKEYYNDSVTAKFKRITFPNVDLILVGGQSLSTSQTTFLRTIFPCARIVQTYACTEAASSLTFHDVTKDDGRHKSFPTVAAPTDLPLGVAVGRPPSHVQLQITSPTTNQPINDAFQVGLLSTRGPHLMSGYWNEKSSALEVKRNFWYVTSDFVFRDNTGAFYFCGRRTDTIRTGGETVWATEVEQVLGHHGIVKEIAVFGLPDERLGETVACAVVLNTGDEEETSKTTAWQKDLQIFGRQNGLSSYKLPRKWLALSTLPRNTSGKILKHRLVHCFDIAPCSRL
jgi:acyl-CoA synthetase (AMP-forming)/AMP-acid ligase II